MAMPYYQFQHLQQQQQQQEEHQLLQSQQQQQQQENRGQSSLPFRNFCTLGREIPPPVAYCSGRGTVPDQSHPPYVPPFHVVGLAPGPVRMSDGDDGCGEDTLWDYVPEQKRKRLKEQDLLENNSHLPSVDFLQTRSVSTGLGLSLEDAGPAGYNDSQVLSVVGDEIAQELERQDAEVCRYLKIQSDRLKQAILDKVRADQLSTISYVEEKILQKVHEKEAQVESIKGKNAELEERMEQLASEAGAWQERAKYTENVIAFLKLNLQQVYAQTRDSKEGCGDSEVDDTASCCNGRAVDFHLLCKDSSNIKELMTCKVCRSREVCMLLLPCKHLCLCKDCESMLSACPLCHCSKYIGMEIYM